MPWRPKVPSPTWRSFLHNHLTDIAAIDMFVVAKPRTGKRNQRDLSYSQKHPLRYLADLQCSLYVPYIRAYPLYSPKHSFLPDHTLHTYTTRQPLYFDSSHHPLTLNHTP